MNRRHVHDTYTTRFVEDRQGGSAGLELYCETHGEQDLTGRLIYWDATAQWAFETFDEIRLTIVEEWIAEAKQAIKTS